MTFLTANQRGAVCKVLGWMVVKEVGGAYKTMLRFIARRVMGFLSPPELFPSLPSDEPVMDYSSSPSNLDGF